MLIEELYKEEKKATFYTDGACSENPGVGGWAFVEIVPCEDGYKTKVTSGSMEETTNNEMELLAVYYAMLKAYKEDVRNITIYSDSAYVINSISKNWLLRWKNNGWLTSEGKPVKNRKIWEKIAKLIYEKGLYVNFVKVKGHSSDLLNQLADERAVKEIENKKREILGI